MERKPRVSKSKSQSLLSDRGSQRIITVVTPQTSKQETMTLGEFELMIAKLGRETEQEECRREKTGLVSCGYGEMALRQLLGSLERLDGPVEIEDPELGGTKTVSLEQFVKTAYSNGRRDGRGGKKERTGSNACRVVQRIVPSATLEASFGFAGRTEGFGQDRRFPPRGSEDLRLFEYVY